MGYNTAVLILNDAWGQILDHPEEFVKGLYEAQHEGGDVGVGFHANVAHVMKTAHADVYRVYITHGNWIIEIDPGLRDEKFLARYRGQPYFRKLIDERCRWVGAALREFRRRLKRALDGKPPEEIL